MRQSVLLLVECLSIRRSPIVNRYVRIVIVVVVRIHVKTLLNHFHWTSHWVPWAESIQLMSWIDSAHFNLSWIDSAHELNRFSSWDSMTGPVKIFFSVQIITKQRSYVQLTAVNNVNGKKYFYQHDHGLSMIRTSIGTGRIITRAEAIESPPYV